MKKTLCFLLITFSASAAFNTLAQAPTKEKRANCRIVDVMATKSGDTYYVDGMKMPQNVTVIEYLRRKEATSPRTCLLLFVPSSVKIRDVADMDVVAGKMQYEDFHAYLYDQHREQVMEILPGPPVRTKNLRTGPRGELSWPDRPPKQ